jgi:hypothetical protein
MDDLSLPDRLEPVAATEPTRRPDLSSDRRRRRDRNPVLPDVRDDNRDPPQDDEELHTIDEIV